MHIIADRFEVAIAASIDDLGFITAAEQMAEELMAPIEAAGINSQQPCHARHQVGLGRLDDQMKMIAHQAPGVDAPTGSGTSLIQALQEKLAVCVRFEDCFATIAPAHNMVDGPRILNSQLSSHTPSQTGLLSTSILQY